MKALYMESPKQYGMTQQPMPEPLDDEVLIRVHKAGLCHSDVIIRSGKADHVLYPFIPGHEFSGVIEATGKQVRHLQLGDRVTVHTILACGMCPACRRGDIASCENYDELGSRRNGGFAEYCSVPARWVFKVADHLSFEEAALTEPLANACAAVRACNVQEGDRVVIIGPGPIGLLAIQVARLSHPSSIVLVGTRQARLKQGIKMGATHTINIREEMAQDQLRELLENKGADVVLECAGTPSALQLALDIAGRNCRIAIEGSMDIEDSIPIYPRRILVNAMHLIGICGWRTEDFTRALSLMTDGKVEVKQIITQTYCLDKWEQAFDMATKHKDESIKVELSMI